MNKIAIILVVLTTACQSGAMKKQSNVPEEKMKISSNSQGNGPEIDVELFKGNAFYYPLIAVWLEDASGNYIQTLYVAKSVATGVFRYGKQEKNKWVAGQKRQPQTLPYWSHKRAVKASDGLYMPDQESQVADAYSGATPTSGFVLNAKADKSLPGVFKVMLEINQNWDWNEYWTNDKYPGDENYKNSCQPALVYEAIVNSNNPEKSYRMKAIGHSHYSGKTGELFPDLSTITTALQIADSIIVKIK